MASNMRTSNRPRRPRGDPGGTSGAAGPRGIAYDPELDRVYIGVGNGTPWNRLRRSPEGGDNLYLSSIVAVDASRD